MTWRLAASTGCCTQMPVIQMLDLLHQAGVVAVELGTPPRHFDPWSHEQVTELGDRLQQVGIEPVSIHAPFGGPFDLSDQSFYYRNAAIGAVLACASALRDLGGTRVVVHTTDVPRDGQNVDERLTRCARSLRVLARSCAHMDMTLVVETPLPHLIGGHPDEFAYLLRHLDRRVGVCIDTSHATLGHHWDRMMELVGDRVVHVHANDHRGHGDDHLVPGDGIIDWARVRKTLEEVHYEGWIVLELTCPADSLASYMRGALERAGRLFGQA
jgi:sugar phosphate isomerase/epimerase